MRAPFRGTATLGHRAAGLTGLAMGKEPQGVLTDEQKSALIDRIVRGDLTPQQACENYALTHEQLRDWARIYRREARRAVDEQVLLALSTQGLDVGELPTSEFSGRIEDMAVAELVQTVQFGRKDAEIRVEHDGEKSYLWCVNGDIVDARSGHLVGAPAVYRLLALERGHVHADFAPLSHGRTITVSSQALMLEAARRSDECRQLRKRLGDTTATYVMSDRALSPGVEATPEQFAVLRLFEKERSIDGALQGSYLPDLETLTLITELRDKGLLERAQSPRSSQPLAIVTPNPERSFVPYAASLGAAPEVAQPSRRWLWVSVTAGAMGLGVLFALRLTAALDASEGSPRAASPSLTNPEAVTAAAEPACPPGMQLIPGGPAFCLEPLEVTVAQYEQCTVAGGCEAPRTTPLALPSSLGPELRERAESALATQCNAGQPGRDQHPVNCVTELDAERYCRWRGARLPSAAEWAFAAHGSTGRAYPWGLEPIDFEHANVCGAECRAWFEASPLEAAFSGVMFESEDGYPATAPVGTFPRGVSPEGVLDLIGNVAEWTSTRADGAVRGARTSSDVRPGSFVVRGGDFTSGRGALEPPVLQQLLHAEARSPSVGFRCAATPGRTPRRTGASSPRPGDTTPSAQPSLPHNPAPPAPPEPAQAPAEPPSPTRVETSAAAGAAAANLPVPPSR